MPARRKVMEVEDLFLLSEYLVLVIYNTYLVSLSHLTMLRLTTHKLIKTPSFSAWAVLGKPQSENTKGYTESGFQGHLTKVQIWSRALHITNEIQKQVRDCRTEPVLYQGLVLTWAGYDDTVGGVERVVPSHCGQRVCPPGYGGTKCQQLESDKIPPKMEYCPGDLWVIAKNGSAIVSWDEPKFVDNVGIVRIQEKNGHRSGQTLMWGTYDISYVAYDQAGNSASCNFKVYVLCR